jgi:transposase
VVDPSLVSPVPDAPSVEQLLVLLAERDALIVALAGRVAQLEARLGKNSQNSSKPPSTDGYVKPEPRSLRRASGRKPGKQPGEPGFRLEQRPDPDQIVVHIPEVCRGCGSDLAEAPVVGTERRQVFDLPPITLEVTEHQAQRRECGCGAVTTAAFSAEATAPTCYGPGVAALGTYLQGRQHLPVERAAECMADCFGAPVSTGWLASLLPTAAAKLEGFLARAGKELAAADVAYFDETGGRVAAKLWWIHVACTNRWTLYHLDERRGKTAMDTAGVLPSFSGIAVHDGLASYAGSPRARLVQCPPPAGVARDRPNQRAELAHSAERVARRDPPRSRDRQGDRRQRATRTSAQHVREALRRADR